MKLFYYTWKRTIHTKTALISLVIVCLLSIWYGLDSAGYLTSLKYPDLPQDTHASSVGQTGRAIGRVFKAHRADYSKEIEAELLTEYDTLFQPESGFVSDRDWDVPGVYARSAVEDRWVFSAILTQCSHYEQADSERAALVDKARAIHEFSHLVNDSYSEKEAEACIKVYSKGTAKPLYNAETIATAATSLFDILNGSYAYFSIMMIAVVCVLCSGLIADDRRRGAYAMIYTTEFCGKRLFSARMCTAFGVALLGLAISSVIPFGIYIIRDGGLQGLTAPAQSIASMYGNAYADLKLCPFQVSNLGFLLIVFGMRALSLICFASLTLLCSSLLESQIQAMFFSGGLSIGSFLLQLTAQTNHATIWPTLRIWNPAALFWGTQYFIRFDTVNIAGHPVQRLYPAVLATAFETVLLLWLAYLSDRRRKHG